MNNQENYYLKRICKILSKARIKSGKTVVELCAEAGFDTRNAYYSLISGKCYDYDTFLKWGKASDLSDALMDEYIEMVNGYLGNI